MRHLVLFVNKKTTSVVYQSSVAEELVRKGIPFSHKARRGGGATFILPINKTTREIAKGWVEATPVGVIEFVECEIT